MSLVAAFFIGTQFNVQKMQIERSIFHDTYKTAKFHLIDSGPSI